MSLLGIRWKLGEDTRFSTGHEMGTHSSLIKIFKAQKSPVGPKLLHKHFKIGTIQGSGQLKCKGQKGSGQIGSGAS